MRATRLMNNCRPKLVTFDVTGTLLSTTIKEHYYNVDTEILLDYLNNKNITIGVISNFDERLEEILISTKLRKYFNFIITSWSHGYEKPNSTIFQEAIKISKNINKFTIKPDEVIHIGDDINNDYNGAKNPQ
ncbi:haloacid dehalogenase-like hydrolase domain-containing protein 3 [Aphidius gifuensis]|uniref:haloacid dehalogenase-like hydrolase domain-containing protein 3 n=1 Tax=Aphidius gifuensis TaxID=684658 RepID=UPI001CDC6EFC|nr:haloacid dehalogenase-like hydrolase domain-containing protein 3 [Aphidius gifuensis]